MKRTALIAALACSLALAGPALAQEERSFDQNFEYESYDTSTSGTIESIRLVDVQGEAPDHVIVRVRPHEPGPYAFEFIDLGSERELRNSGVRVFTDQSITAYGEMSRINGRPVLMAERISLDGDRYALNRSGQFRDTERVRTAERQEYEHDRDYDTVWPYEESPDFERSGEYPTTRQYERDYDRRHVRANDEELERLAGRDDVFLVRGEVQSLQDFAVEGVGEDHRLMKITDTTRADRRTWVVDLGPTSGALADLELEEGDRVMVQGHPARVEGRPVIHAVQVAEVFSEEDEFAAGEMLSNRLRRDSPEPQDSMGSRIGKPQHHDLPSRTSSDERNF